MLQLDDRDYAHFYFDDYDLEAQLIAIRNFLARSSEDERQEDKDIKALARRAEEIGSDHLVGMYTDSVHASVYSGAARSAAAVGMLAPFVENLFTGIFRGIGSEEDDYLGRDKNSTRSKNARAHFWDPHVSFGSSEVKTNLIDGIMQLADASKLAPRLPSDTRKILEALFEYRNGMLHAGFEWPPARRERFAQRVRTWDANWFISAQSGGKPWVWYMSDLFIDRIFSFIDEVLIAAGQHARETYFPQT
ncbi:conserved hypothetical protein [Sphingomonas sp. EC-HK361]|uniref:hypothetical protein n=1 Tax=Sphingomonas sp. EC-HK361 TaxID=2038397 RepID=UPI001256D1B8|nr:hypothetical protein [Sphingomonas sp. EC-HK361]VVT10229.1 conserved hypothetical protein [Sphingomonas sp. EC-HK361]